MNDQIYQRALSAHNAGEHHEAERLYHEILATDPQHGDSWFGLAVIEAQRGNAHESIILFERSIQFLGIRATHHHNLAGVKVTLGRFAEVDAHYREAIRLDPEYAEAYFNYANSKKFTAETASALLENINELLKKPRLRMTERVFLNFAAGKLHGDLNEYELAWAAYEAGNKAKPVQADMVKMRHFSSRTLERFDAETLSRLSGKGAVGDIIPVFIVGMPRSGTTLLEQVLASHPEVFGAGELPDIPAIAVAITGHLEGSPDYPDARGLTPELLKGFGEAYLRSVVQKAGSARIIVDKNPLNYRFVGLIQLLLPNARIIYAKRHPLDTCLSCYFQNFRAGQEYSFNLEHLAETYGICERMMQHWSALLPEIYTAEYSKLVQDFDQESKRIFDVIGIDWSPQVVNFHKTERQVETASQWQVRQPLNTKGLERWRCYDKHLGPLKSALRRFGVEWEE